MRVSRYRPKSTGESPVRRKAVGGEAVGGVRLLVGLGAEVQQAACGPCAYSCPSRGATWQDGAWLDSSSGSGPRSGSRVYEYEGLDKALLVISAGSPSPPGPPLPGPATHRQVTDTSKDGNPTDDFISTKRWRSREGMEPRLGQVRVGQEGGRGALS